ncbi:substrate-binding domain-containing protein [Tengunoibacter tsumagoiensis]|uniref:HTH gntR-type domain-containing protein n=1 Tax=Tengunoibacter tsumagoiensis TaxID=2014871 RepID=A0A401ZUF7_9CHLR|nr:substrate-binding domain-containing protein [Tengunoibacter tsumagoiensis]GCE10588.1 hypothetical protein KTT_04470 [Tengunoibacter tsumagoiensis]
MTRNNQRLQGVTMYERIAQDLREKILDGKWAINSALPSRPKLASEYQVAPLTIERAINILLAEGVLHSINGRGTFVHALPQSSVQKQSVQELPVPEISHNHEHLVGRSAKTKALTVALIDGDMPASPTLSPHPNPETGQDWMTLILTSLQRSWSRIGGRSISISRFEGIDLHSVFTLKEALLLAIEQGATAIAISNILDVQNVTSIVLSTIDIQEIPVVLFSWEPLITPLPYVIYDHAYAGYSAVQHLLAEGYDPIYYLDIIDWWWSKERLRGVKAALRDAGRSESELQLVQMDKLAFETLVQSQSADSWNPYAEGYAAGKHFFMANKKPSQAGFIAPNDWAALGWLTAAQEVGLSAGRDFGLIGFDNIPRADRSGLTTLAPPLEEMGQEAARLLLAMMQGHPTSLHSSLRSHLMIRTSTRRIHPRI